MKNKKMFVVLVFALFIVLSFNRVYAEKYKPEGLKLENIEVLASGENGSVHRCLYVGSLDCPYSGDKVKSYY